PWNGSTTFLDNQDNYCQQMSVHPTDSETVFLGGVNLYRGNSGFAVPGAIEWVGGWLYGNHHADLHWLVFQPGSSTVAYTGSDGGVHRTANAQAATVVWSSLNNGYNTCQFYTAAIDENLPGSTAVIGGMQDNGTWFSGVDLPTNPWTETLSGDGGFCAVADASGPVGTYYMSYQQNYGIYRMNLDNTTGVWTAWSRIDPGGGDTSLWLKPYILDPNDTRMMYLAADDVVWRNSDLTGIPDYNSGTANINWSNLTTGAAGVPVTALAMSRSANRILYFGNMDGNVYRLNNADTAPSGSPAVRLDIGSGFPAGGYVSSIAVHPQDDQQVLVAFSNYNVVNIFYSDNGGASWTAVEGNLGGVNSPSVRSVAFMPAMAVDFYFAATSTGLYSSFLLDGAATVWQQEGADEIGNVVVDMVAVRPADNLVVAGTHGKGVFRGYLGASDVPANDRPELVRLDQNVPNPFNPTTTIKFGLTAAGPVTVRIHDVSGRLVKSLLEGSPRQAGEHSLTWRGDDANGRPVGSGVYLCSVRSRGVEKTRSLTLVR
ncbi:MAG: FlgD immunoglobulin-like domain containing protein, partial [Candidatus Krumholzibacteriota bacterium]